MKLVITQIAEPLCKLINNSFSSGIVPDELKIIAKVCPVYKNGDRAQFCNFYITEFLRNLWDIGL